MATPGWPHRVKRGGETLKEGTDRLMLKNGKRTKTGSAGPAPSCQLRVTNATVVQRKDGVIDDVYFGIIVKIGIRIPARVAD